METLDDVFLVGTPTRPAAVDAFAGLFGAAPPAGYGEVLARFGKSQREIGRGFLGLLAIYTPEEAQANRSPGYFTEASAPNFTEHFHSGDGERLVSLANSVDAEDLVFLPGKAPIYYFPNPRSGGDIEIAGESLVDALEHYRARRERNVAYFVSESAAGTRHDVGRDFDTTTLLYTRLKPDLYDEESSNFFYRRAGGACVSVFNDGRILKVYTGTDHDAFRAELAQLFEGRF